MGQHWGSTSNEPFQANTKGTSSRLATGSVFRPNLLLFVPEYNTELQPAPLYFGEISPLAADLYKKHVCKKKCQSLKLSYLDIRFQQVAKNIAGLLTILYFPL
jgi:hypothetical protein